MSATPRPEPLGGRILTPTVVGLLGLTALGVAMILYRAAVGLGGATAMNDGYAWGLWIAFDVVTGTALGCGGYVIAMLVYILNRGKYHPLIRPAMLTSALGYTIAALSVMLDLGRPWMTWKIPIFVWQWNAQSELLEVALCIMTYTVVLWFELTPAMLERATTARWPVLRKVARVTLPKVRSSMLWVTALGVLLPTMHQSSLGGLLLLSGPRLHPLWNSPLLPLLFLFSCVLMGFGAVVIEGLLSARYLGARSEIPMLADLGRIIVGVAVVFVVVRLADVAMRGHFGDLLRGDVYAIMWIFEVLLLALVVAMLATDAQRKNPANLFRGAMLLLFAGGLYRFDVFLLAFSPGPDWHYFPSVPEILITLGLVAAEAAIYIIFVRTLPILSALPGRPPGPAAPNAARGLS
ncbi:MAG TPA: Ni/Fe-hydrogenase cytochrome b subunit [Candidatus Binatia bacterium]|jgi:Ni/Fe-hydrogenase subunit HybB-like protein